MGTTKTLRLKLDGRGGDVGLLTWGIAGPNDARPTTGYTVSQSVVAQDMFSNGNIHYTGPSGTTFTDEITLDGTAIAAALGITEWTTPVQFFIELTEDGNGAGSLAQEFFLMDEYFDFGDLSHSFAHNDTLIDGTNWIPNFVDREYYGPAYPNGQRMNFPITSVTADNDCFTITETSDGYNLYAAKEGTTIFTVTLAASAEGIVPVPSTFTFTDKVVSTLYEIQLNVPNGDFCILKNETKSFSVQVNCLTAEINDYGECHISNTTVDSFTLTATSSDPTVVDATTTNTKLHLMAKAFPDVRDANITLTATGTHNGEPFTATVVHVIAPMDRCGLLEYSDSYGAEIDLNVGIDGTIDLSQYFRYTLQIGRAHV